MIRVVVADDHPVVRKGLCSILTEGSAIQVTGEANNAQEVLALLGQVPADVLVLDIGMPGRSGLELLQDLKLSHPKLPVLILSQYPEEQIAVRAIRSGASGYLNKESAPDQLDCVRQDGFRHCRRDQPHHQEDLVFTIRQSLVGLGRAAFDGHRQQLSEISA